CSVKYFTSLVGRLRRTAAGILDGDSHIENRLLDAGNIRNDQLFTGVFYVHEVECFQFGISHFMNFFGTYPRQTWDTLREHGEERKTLAVTAVVENSDATACVARRHIITTHELIAHAGHAAVTPDNFSQVPGWQV